MQGCLSWNGTVAGGSGRMNELGARFRTFPLQAFSMILYAKEFHLGFPEFCRLFKT